MTLRRWWPVLLTVPAFVLFLAYLRMSRAVTVNSDGASNALQAWDLFHGNLLLRGWTLSDVSFYPTELIQYGLIQLVTGVTTDQIHIAAALSWTLVVCFAAWLAHSVVATKPSASLSTPLAPAPPHSHPVAPTPLGAADPNGPATPSSAQDSPSPAPTPTIATTSSSDTPGRATTDGGPVSPFGRLKGALASGGWLAAAIAVAIVLLPAPGYSYQTLLSSPNHTGSAVPLLITWLLIDRARDRPWLPFAVAIVLAWGAMGDPLITFVGAAPLIVVCAYRALLARSVRGLDARLAAAGIASVILSHGILWLIERLGGFRAPKPPIEFSPMEAWPDRAHTVTRMIGILFGTVRPGIQAPWVETTLQLVRLPGLLLAIVAVLVTAVAALRGTADRVDAILAAAIVCDVAAEIVSTLPSDLMATREVVPVLSMAAVLAARVTTRWLRAPSPAPRRARIRVAAQSLSAAILAVLLVALAAYAPPRAAPVEGQEAADWLRSRGLQYGLGSYWVSNNITVGTGRQVTVVPTLSGDGELLGMCWQTHTDMFDPAKHDARFVLLEKQRPFYGTPDDVETQYGPPVERKDFDLYVIFVYDKNLLEDFTPTC
ncbi:hypothetical protein ABT369_36545 [Dactylosporangium sp. NPDC000244]|uniref:hypothetical protein n=1 Tax=Dactylosporangium sp. NPDC000244 TaxID=3154365 RepID=UPI0033279E01